MKSKKLRQGLKFYTSMMGAMVILCVFGAILALIHHEWMLGICNLFWACIAYGKHEDIDAIGTLTTSWNGRTESFTTSWNFAECAAKSRMNNQRVKVTTIN